MTDFGFAFSVIFLLKSALLLFCGIFRSNERNSKEAYNNAIVSSLWIFILTLVVDLWLFYGIDEMMSGHIVALISSEISAFVNVIYVLHKFPEKMNFYFKKVLIYAGILFSIVLISSAFFETSIIDEDAKTYAIISTLDATIILHYAISLFILYRNTYNFKNAKAMEYFDYVNSCISEAENYYKLYINGESTKRTYNIAVKNINKELSRKDIYKTFSPKFKECNNVIYIINLFETFGNNNVKMSYQEYRAKYERANAVELPEKANRKSDLIEMNKKLKLFFDALYLAKTSNENYIRKLKNSDNYEYEIYKKINLS